MHSPQIGGNMKKWDVIFYNTHQGHYITRVEAKDEESAKEKVRKENDDIWKITKVKEAEDYICYNYRSVKEGNKVKFEKQYYSGYMELPMFGYGAKFEFNKARAKRFTFEKEIRDELRKIGRRMSEFKIEKVKGV